MQTIFPKIPESIINEIKKRESIAIIAHKNPDGDALSSTLALKEILTYLKKDCIALNDGPFEKKELFFLENQVSSTVPDSFDRENGLVIILDCSTPDRPGNVFSSLSGMKTIVIDHHSSGVSFVPDEMSYIVPSSPSTTLLVEELRVALSVPLTEKIAFYLYIGLATDTGFFHFLNEEQGEHAFSKAALFISMGLNPYDIYDRLNDGKSLEELKILSSTIEKAKSFYGGKLIIAEQPLENKDASISDSLYQQLLSVDKVQAVALIKHKEEGKIVLGLRAKRLSGLDVGSIAMKLGGGGHKLAAGATIDSSKGDAKSFVISLFKEYLE